MTEMLLGRAQAELERLRGSPSMVKTLEYSQSRDDDGGDRNERARALVLWALQYDRRRDDLPLARWLMDQEIRCRAEAGFQGLTEQAQLVGFLVAEHRDVNDVWRHYEMKRANFDTFCGYDLAHLFAAGVANTLEFIRNAQHPDRDALLRLLLDSDGDPYLDDQEVARWFAAKREWFPSDPEEEGMLVWADRAIYVGDHDTARHCLDGWARSRPRTQDVLANLGYRLEELGDYAQAAALTRERLPMIANDESEVARVQLSLAKLERKAGAYDAAWQALLGCRQALAAWSGWQELGIGRMLVEEMFLLAGSAPPALATVVFRDATTLADIVPRLPVVAYDAALRAAEHVDDCQKVEHYRAARDAEQLRWATELAQLKSRAQH